MEIPPSFRSDSGIWAGCTTLVNKTVVHRCMLCKFASLLSSVLTCSHRVSAPLISQGS